VGDKITRWGKAVGVVVCVGVGVTVGESVGAGVVDGETVNVLVGIKEGVCVAVGTDVDAVVSPGAVGIPVEVKSDSGTSWLLGLQPNKAKTKIKHQTNRFTKKSLRTH
jgi:hypothetical protein